MYFQYKAINKVGKNVLAVIEADNEKEVIKSVKKLKLDIISIKAVKKQAKIKIKPPDLLIFTRLFTRLIKSHIPIIQSLDIIRQNIDNTPFKNVINNVSASIEKGDSLSEALRKQGNTFSEFYCSLISAGENSGKLDITLEMLYKHLKTQQEIKRKFQSALFYPVFVIITAFIVLSLIFTFVVPQFQSLFLNFDTKLPALTQFIFDVSLFVKNNFTIILSGLTTIVIGNIIFFKTPKGRDIIDKYIFKIPFLGKLIKESISTRFAQVLALLVKSDVDIILSFQILEGVMNNNFVKNKLKKIRVNIRNGQSITDSVKAASFFPNTIIQMIKAGEESGDLNSMLESAAQFYEENLNVKINIFASILQPILIIIIGLIIAVIIISIFLPVFQLGTFIK